LGCSFLDTVEVPAGTHSFPKTHDGPIVMTSAGMLTPTRRERRSISLRQTLDAPQSHLLALALALALHAEENR
jgi:hypothetical protein